MKVLVTGATGFVAGQCIEELLTHGYQVRGTVRNLRTARTGHLHELAERVGGDLELVEADLTADAGWVEAMRGCTYVWHVASPFPSRVPSDENELIRPAVDGTLRVLRAAQASGTVRRVVLTSSLAAVYYGHDDDDRTFTEADWTVVAGAGPYPKSKTLAEKAAWDFVAGTDLELVAVNPGTIFGPLLNADCSTSLELILRMMTGRLPLVPKLGWEVVDVRDLARLHRLATETPAAAGQRYVAAGQYLWSREIATVLAGHFRPRGYRIGTAPMPYALMWLIARFDPAIRLGLTFWGHRMRVTAAKAQTELGWTMRPAEQTLIDTAESMIRVGLVPARRRATKERAAAH